MSLFDKNVGVYVDSDVCRCHLNSIEELPEQIIFDQSVLTQFIDSNYQIKFSSFHVPFPPERTWLDRFNTTYSVANHTFIFCSELHEATVQQLIELDLPNVSIFTCGILNHQFEHAHIGLWLDWFDTTSYIYAHHRPGLIDEKLKISGPKSKYFDILLGCQREHRDFVYHWVHTNELVNYVIMTYFRWWHVDIRLTDHIFETDGVELTTNHHALYFGKEVNLSQVIPFVIYNDTFYTLVTETNAVNHFNFYTEKIVKPLLTKRLFIAIAGQGYLKNLRSFGFKTFDSVIDESYDNEPDHVTRWTMALEQMKLLCSIDPYEIQAKIKDVVEHNQRLILTKNWTNSVTTDVRNIILSCLVNARAAGD